MQRRSLSTYGLIALLGVACREPEAAPAPEPEAAQPAVPATADAAPKDPTEDVTSTRPAEPTPEQLAQARKAFLTALDEGRALTKAADYAGGIAKYREALAIDGSDPTALAELGWAAFLSGDLDAAEHSTEQALRFARRDSQRGMVLYNLGRVLEARGDDVGAVELYHRSLAARPNATVEKRLATLASATKPPEKVPIAARRVLARDLADLEAACSELVKKKCSDIGGAHECTCEPELEGADASGTWGLLRVDAATVGEQAAWFPAVKAGPAWVVFERALWLYNPGALGIWEEAEIREPTLRDVIPGGEDELVLTLSKSRSDRDMGVNEIETEHWSLVLLCSRDRGTARCASFTESYTYSREIEFPDEETEEGRFDHTPGLPLDSHYRATLDLSAGKANVAVLAVSADLERADAIDTLGAMLPPGVYDLGTLLLPPP